ncbi:MAG: carboxynorspermidine decarboxylase [Christensenellaceae bacterium]
MKFEQIKTPCYVVDKDKLIANLEILKRLENRTGAKVLLAQKAFSCYALYPLIAKYLSGATASGLYEARLSHEEMKKENHVYSPAYDLEEIKELAKICDHIIFNSVAQKNKFMPYIKGVSAGLRINPECSTQEHAIYDPCAPFSRLGVTRSNLKSGDLSGIEGFHVHTLCEQNSDALKKTVDALEKGFGEYLYGLKWLNLGGGHHITRQDYDINLLEDVIRRLQSKYGVQIYLEPGEAVALNAGYLYADVLEIVHNGMDIAVLNASAACHMPDVLEMPYRPPLLGAGQIGEKKYGYRLSSRTCLAGDIIGDYSFDDKLKEGDRLCFLDMAIYTIVKNNTFNGMPLPSIYVKSQDDYQLIKEFSYRDFKERLS